MTTRLQIYNGALRICETRSIASLSVNEEARRVLDEIWNDGGVRFALERGQWKFAMRAAQMDYNPAIVPEFGYSRAFTKPSDWVETSAVCTDEYFNSPLTQYADEVGYWYADMDTIYVKFVSDHAAFGNDLTRWPATFAEYVQHYFARKACKRLPGGKELYDTILKAEEKALRIARSRDAMTSPTTFPARGSWLTSRFGRGGVNRRDGGNRNGNLIG